jgi:hypothetical protein
MTRIKIIGFGNGCQGEKGSRRLEPVPAQVENLCHQGFTFKVRVKLHMKRIFCPGTHGGQCPPYRKSLKFRPLRKSFQEPISYGKTYFSVILKEVRDLKLLIFQDSSLHSE